MISGMEPKGQPNEQMEEVVLQPTQPKLVSTKFEWPCGINRLTQVNFWRQVRISLTPIGKLWKAHPEFFRNFSFPGHDADWFLENLSINILWGPSVFLKYEGMS